MNRKVAEQLKASALECVRKLDESVAMVQQEAPDELKEYRRAVGWILSEIDDLILRPIYTEHPELEPEALRRSSSGTP